MSNFKNSLINELVLNQKNLINQQIADNFSKLPRNNDTSTVISKIPDTGLYIDKPGTYVFGNDIVWTPPNPYLFAAIVINCNNVVLDLKGFQLTGEGVFIGNSLGIIVIDGDNTLSNITIKNGIISNIGLCGVWSVNVSGLIIDNITVKGLCYSGFDFVPAGISLWECNSFIIEQCRVQDANVTAMLGAGIMLLGCKNEGKVKACAVDELDNNDGVACGFLYTNCSDVDTTNCTASNLNTYFGGNSLSKIGHTCIGFMPFESNNLLFDACSSINIKGCCDDCHGMSLFNVDTVQVSKFTAKNVLDGDCPQKTGAKATGLEVYGNNITVKNSHVSQIIAIMPQDLQSTGFSACGNTIIFDSCSASDVQIWDENMVPNIQNGYGTGFGWAPDPRPNFLKPAVNVTYENCEANNCQLGFDTWNHQNSNWIKTSAINCGKDYLVESKGTKRIYSMNFCSELPDSVPTSPSQSFPIFNSAENNNYLD